jgi:hypothetical protein
MDPKDEEPSTEPTKAEDSEPEAERLDRTMGVLGRFGEYTAPTMLAMMVGARSAAAS